MRASFKSFIENRSVKSVGKFIDRKFKNKPLSKQVEAMKNLIAAAAGVPGSSQEKAMRTVRANLLKKQGLPADIKGMAKKGMTQVEIKDYYWSCPEFMSFWTNDLGMEEATLDELIRGTTEA